MAAETQTRINLTALKRRDPYIEKILDSATHVAIYTFNPTSGEWEKTDIEGTLFVYSRLAPPTAGFTIMNQLSMDNLTEILTRDHEFQNQSPFLLYRNAKMQIYGIWFYDMYDCSRIGNLLVELCSKKIDMLNNTSNNDPPTSNSPISSSSSSALSLLDGNFDEDLTLTSANLEDSVLNNNNTNPVDILQILSKAKKEYDKVNIPKKEDGRKLQNKISKADLFKPVATESDSKKVNVASLFEQSDSKKDGRVKRPSSVNTLTDGGKQEKKTLSKPQQQQNTVDPHRRYGSRSLSLSFTQEQFQNNLPNVVNGAISVEELESPVMGMPANRTRYYPVNDNNFQSTLPPRLSTTETSGPFHKLLNRVDNAKNTDSTSATYTNSLLGRAVQGNQNAAELMTRSGDQLKINFQRSMSIPTAGKTTAAPKVASSITPNPSLPLVYPCSSSTSLSSLISVFPNAMPTLHEHVSPRTSLMKSISLTSGMSEIPLTTTIKNPSLQVAATLHGTTSKNKEQADLLSPSVLHFAKSSSQNASGLASTFASMSTSASTPQSSFENSQASGDPKTLISPEDFEHSSTTPQKAMQLHKRLLPAAQQSNNVEPLDKTQLANTLIYLLQSSDAPARSQSAASLDYKENKET